MDPAGSTAGVAVEGDGPTGSVVSIIVASVIIEGLTSGCVASVETALTGEVSDDGNDAGGDDGSCWDNFSPPDSDGFFERARRTWYLFKINFPM